MSSSDLKQNPLTKVGKIVDAHSLKGEVKVFVFSGEAESLKDLKRITVMGPQSDGDAGDARAESPVHFEIERARFQGANAVFKFKGIDDRTAAENLKGSLLYADTQSFISRPGEKIFLREIMGFRILNDGVEVGLVDGFESNGPQDLLVVRSGGGEVLIPLIGEFLVSIDFENKFVNMRLPQGLLDVNRKE